MAASSNVTSEELTEGGEEENSPTLPEQEANSRPRRIALFVEPSPFSWVPLQFLFFFFVHVIVSSLRPFMLSLLAKILCSIQFKCSVLFLFDEMTMWL